MATEDGRIGDTVPWVAAWTGEQEFNLQPSANFPGRTEIVQVERPGTGTPLFNGMHVIRQRLGVIHHLCHVCGRPTAPGDRYLFPQSTGAFVTMKSGEARYANHTPPVHAACAERAHDLCPHLSGARPRPVRFPTDPGRMQCETNPPPGMMAVAQTLPPGLPVVFSYFRLHTPAFSRLVQRLRNEADQGRP